MKKLVSLTTAALVLVATAMPVFAASPSTATVMDTAVSASTSVAAAKGYAVSPAEAAATATTPAQAVTLATTSTVDPVGDVVEIATSPAVIAMAKLDILKNADVQSTIIKNGGSGVIVSSAMLTNQSGKSSRRNVRVKVAGTVPGDKVTIIYYLPGDPTPRTRTATVRSNGKIHLNNLPVPCVYNVVR